MDICSVPEIAGIIFNMATAMNRKERLRFPKGSINAHSYTETKTRIIADRRIINRYLNTLLSNNDSLTPIRVEDYEDIVARRPNVGMFSAENIKSLNELTTMIQSRIIKISGEKPCSVMMEINSNPSFIHLDDFQRIVAAIEGGGAQDYKNSINFSNSENNASINMFVFYNN